MSVNDIMLFLFRFMPEIYVHLLVKKVYFQYLEIQQKSNKDVKYAFGKYIALMNLASYKAFTYEDDFT